MDYYMPTRFFSGEKILEKHNKEFDLGKKCLIVTGKNSAKKCGALDDVTSILKQKDIEYIVYDSITPNPFMKDCIEAGNIAKDNGCDFVVGIGGGSVLDASKVVSVVATNPNITKEEIYGIKFNNKGLPLILIGTTSGTGSEVTKVAVITDEDNLRKKSGHHDYYYANVAFGDPTYTMSLNREYTISTGIDALAHSVESYFSNKANDISRAFSIKSVKMLLKPLQELLNEDIKLDYKQREDLYNASILGGLAINITGTTFAHTLGYYITENYKQPHGIACAMFMNDLIEYEYKNNKEYTEEFFKDIDMNKDDYLKLINSLLPIVDIKMSKEEIDSIMPRYENNNSIKNTKGAISSEEIRKILETKFSA